MLRRYRTPDKVDATMASINEQREIANEISDAISNPLNAGIELDDVRSSLGFVHVIFTDSSSFCSRSGCGSCTTWKLQDELKAELAELEQEELNERLVGATKAPTTSLPNAPTRESRESYFTTTSA